MGELGEGGETFLRRGKVKLQSSRSGSSAPSGRFMHGFRLRRKWFLVSKQAKGFVVMVRDTFKEKTVVSTRNKKTGLKFTSTVQRLALPLRTKYIVFVEKRGFGGAFRRPAQHVLRSLR